MSFQAFGIMLKPILAKYLEPLEADGTIAKLQRDVSLIAQSNAIPELATLVSELQEHNRLMNKLFELIEGAANNGDYTKPAPGDFEPGSHPGTTGLIGDHSHGLSELSGPD